MKRNFQKSTNFLSKVALVVVGLSAASLSFASEKGLHVEAPAYGQAILTVEDLQTLLGLKIRNPSSQEATQGQDVLVSAPIFQMRLDAADRARVAKALASLRHERAAFAKKLEKQKSEQVKALRAERRNIQISRTRLKEETAAGQSLFSSLLAESNAEAGVASRLADFDRDHAVELQFAVDAKGSRSVAAIKLGRKIVWQNNALLGSRLAKR